MTIDFDLVDEVPEKLRPSPYDPVVAAVRETGKIARVATTRGSLHTLANRLRKRYVDLEVEARTTEDGFYVYLSRKETK